MRALDPILRGVRLVNKTEAAYAQRLRILRAAGLIADCKWESLKFRLADKTWYTPDFVVVLKDGHMECHEVKGFWRDDARVKFKVARELYPWFTWKVARKVKGGF